jgi:hypothetical protein
LAAPAAATDDEDSYVQVSLAAIERWERLLYDESADLRAVDANVTALSLLEDLTRLYEVTKLPAAREHILRLLNAYRLARRYGFSADGMLAASVVRLELKRSVFRPYSIFLINIENRSGVDLQISDWRFVLALTDERTLEPESLSEAHPLYPALQNQLGGFRPPGTLSAGRTASFKLVFGEEELTPEEVRYLRIDLDEYRIVVKFYEHLG